MEAVWLVLVVVAAAGWSQQRREIRRLAARLDALEGRRPPATTMPPAPAMPAAQVAVPAGPVAQADIVPPPAPAAPPPAPPPGSDLERRFGQRWLVWIGAVALALGGLFVVQYSIEQDLIGPRTRLAFGLLTGIVLIVMAELLRKQPGRLGLGASQTAGAAAALAAGGASALFGVAWASFGRYGLLGPELALAAMALAAATALLLAWHHGPLLAVVALVFAYLAPVLAATDTPDPVAFAVWLVAIQLFLALLLRFRPWTWLLALDLLGLIPMGVLLMVGSRTGTTLAPLVAAAAVALPVWLAWEPDRPEGRSPVRILRRVAGVGGRAWLGGLLLAACAVAANEQSELALLPLPIAALVLVAAALAGRARLHVAFAGAFAVAVAALLIDLPIVTTAMAELLGDPVTATPAWRWLAPELAPYAWFCALTAAAFFLAGWTGALHARPSGGFAALAVVAPLVLLAIAYARIEGFAAAPRWTVVALVMAGLFLLAAERTARLAERPAAVAAFALGVVAALSLACTMALEHAWLSVALAAQVLAVVLVHARFPHSALARAAAALAGLVAGRLLWQAGEAGTGEPGILLVLWAYGVPTLFLLGAWLCGRRLEPAWPRDVILLAATLGWIIVLMRSATALAGGGHDDLLEPGLQVAALTLTATGLALRPQTGPVRLATLLTLLVAVASLLDPLLRIAGGEDLRVLDVPVVNPLLLLLLVPVLALGFLTWRGLPERLPHRLGPALPVFGGLLLLAWPILEIRRGFSGSVLWGEAAIQPAENWLYSAWLVVAAVGLLAFGLLTRQRQLRLLSLALLVAAILKVFLLDLSGLEGLWRAAAFLGLGMTLVGVGLAYQRLFSDDRHATPGAGQ